MDLERHDPGPAPGIRASDAERDRVVGLLKQHFTDGRLTLEEFSERMDVAYAAKTRGELVTTLQELPVLARTRAEAVEPRGEPRGHAHGHRHWAVPLPLIPLALVVLLVGVTVASRGLFLWPLFIFLWIWGGRHARHRHGHYHREWDRRGWHRHYHV